MNPNEQLTAKIEEYCVRRMEWDREYSRQFALNLAGYIGELHASPPPGSVEVKVAVVVGDGKEVSHWPITDESDCDAVDEAEYCNLGEKITHRAIVRAWIPPIAKTPEVVGDSEVAK